MRKTIILILACIMSLTLCACGKSDAAKAYEEMVAQIGVVSLDSGSAIVAAENAYLELSEKEQKSVSDSWELLLEKRKEYDNAVAAEEQLQEKLTDIVELIDQIGKVTLESESAIVAAEAACAELTTEALERIAYSIRILNDSRLAYDALVMEAMVAHASDVMSIIEEIGAVTLKSESAIIVAQECYNALTEGEKELVTNYADLEAAIKDLEALKAQLKSTLADYEADKNYQAIISVIIQEISDIDIDAEIKATYENAVENYKRDAISAAESYAATGDYASARIELSAALNLIGEDAEVSEKLKEVNLAEVTEIVLAYEAEKNYKDAILYLNANSTIVSESVDLQAKLAGYVEHYRTDVVNEAASAYKSSGYEAAISVLHAALGVLPDDPTLYSEIEKYGSAAPVNITYLDVTQQSDNLHVGEKISSFTKMPHFDEICKDVNGTIYTGNGIHYRGYNYSSTDEQQSITYFLNGEYDSLEGILYRPYVTFSCGFEWKTDGCVEIYGDGALLYSASVSQNSYDVVNINVDITGVKLLKIVLRGVWGDEDFDYWNYYPKCCLADLTVTKELDIP